MDLPYFQFGTIHSKLNKISISKYRTLATINRMLKNPFKNIRDFNINIQSFRYQQDVEQAIQN
jgi:hypothetical protein